MLMNASSIRERLFRLSPVTRGICVVVLLLNLLSLIPSVYNMLALEPGATLPSQAKLWMLITGGYVESSLIMGFVDIAVILVASDRFEQLWGTIEFAKFVAVTNLFACLCASTTFVFLYMVTFNLNFLFHHFSGMSGLYCAFLVAFKHSYPQFAFRAGGHSLEARIFPFTFILLLLTLYLVGLLRGAHVLLACFGALSAWTYLRFFHVHDGAVGDVTDPMAFHDLFPGPLQPVASIVSIKVYRFLTLIHICPLSGFGTGSTKTLPITDADSERRRQLALRDLSTRMATKPTSSSTATTTTTTTGDTHVVVGGAGSGGTSSIDVQESSK